MSNHRDYSLPYLNVVKWESHNCQNCKWLFLPVLEGRTWDGMRAAGVFFGDHGAQLAASSIYLALMLQH